MKKENRKVLSIILRYLILLAVAFPSIKIFYLVFSPLTIYPVYSLLSLIYPVVLSGNTFLISNFSIEIADACVAGSAYFLLVLLNLSLPMNWKKRVFSLIFSLFSFLLINILRIFIFSILLISSFQYFDITHKLFWLFLSGVLVFLVWILTIKIFRLEKIPFYSDIKFLYKLAKRKKSNKK